MKIETLAIVLLICAPALATLNGTYTCQLGGQIRPDSEWKTVEQEMAIVDGEGEAEIKLGELTALVYAGLCCGSTDSRLTFTLIDEIAGVRVLGHEATGSINPGIALYNDKAKVDVATGQINCFWKPRD